MQQNNQNQSNNNPTTKPLPLASEQMCERQKQGANLILFQGVAYPIRSVELSNGDVILCSNTELNDALEPYLDNDLQDEAFFVDNQVAGFLTDAEFLLNDFEIEKLLY